MNAVTRQDSRLCIQKLVHCLVRFLTNWRSLSIHFVTALILLLNGLNPVYAKPDTRYLQLKNIDVSATPIDLDRKNKNRRRFGKLIWLGGVSLSSASVYFGGYSGLVMDASGTKIVGISDSGSWISANLYFGSDGRIAGINNVEIGPLLAPNKRPFEKKSDRDAEGSTLASGDFRRGILYISFENNNRIAIFPIRDGRIEPQKGLIPLPKSAMKHRNNKGLEGLARIRHGPNKGDLVIFAERFKEPDDFLNGWLLSKHGTRRLRLRSVGGYDITDVAPFPDGGILILERRFRYSEGIKVRIRRLYPDALKNKERLDGEVLFEADDSYNIDNMEGITVHLNKRKEAIITLISDDNFNLFQRTLLMQFMVPNSAGQ